MTGNVVGVRWSVGGVAGTDVLVDGVVVVVVVATAGSDDGPAAPPPLDPHAVTRSVANATTTGHRRRTFCTRPPRSVPPTRRWGCRVLVPRVGDRWTSAHQA
jgi:hypothetical protein